MKPNAGKGLTPEPITNREELQRVWEIAKLSTRIPALIDRWERVSNVAEKPNSELAKDNASTQWLGISSVVSTSLHQAADTLHTLHRLIPAEGDISIPYMSHFPIARASLEASSLALWLVGPDDPRDRIARHLAECWRETYEEKLLRRKIQDLMTSSTSPASNINLDAMSKRNKAWSRKRNSYIRKIARYWGLPDPIDGSRVGFARIVREATAYSDVDPLRGEIVWRELSGLSHPSFAKVAQGFRREIMNDDGGGNLEVRFSSPLNTVELALHATLLHFTKAVELVAGRKIRPADPTRYPIGSNRDCCTNR